jgi:hypothetical protein
VQCLEPADRHVAHVVGPGDLDQGLLPPRHRASASRCWCFVSFAGRPICTPAALARRMPSPVRARISSRSNSAVCGAPHNAEFERGLILQRTSEGRVRAMAEGRRFGREPKLTKHQAREALKRVAGGEPLREIALSYNVGHSTIIRLKARYAAKA